MSWKGGVAIAAALFVLLVVVGQAAADYLGPNRTVTSWVWERRHCQYLAVYDPPGAGYYACTLHLYEPPDRACPAAADTAPYFNPHPHACGVSWPGTCGAGLACRITKERDDVESCHEGQQGCRQVEQTVTYPEATISGTLQGCTLQNGWCISSPALSLSAVEPVAGYAILAIEGTHNGSTFSCDGAACTLPLVEGENAFTYWALSTWGDSSRMGSLNARVDTRPPQIDGAWSGTAGENGWYVSPVTFSASASDPTSGSGVASFAYALDGGAWTAYTAPVTVGDGVHTLLFRAEDAAGHTAEARASVQVDTQPPALQTALEGNQANGWYLGQATFTASAADGVSGLARLEYALDGAAWQPYTAPVVVGDGVHTLRVRALDVAGNAQETTLDFQVDGTRPGITLPERWPIWERMPITAHDEQSGLARLEVTIRDRHDRWPAVVWVYAVDGPSFTGEIFWDRRFADGTVAPIGEYEVVVEARDAAGNVTWDTAHLLIPAPGMTPSPGPTRTPQPTATATALPASSDASSSLPAQPAPTSAPAVATFGSAAPSPMPQSPNMLGESRAGSFGRAPAGEERTSTLTPGSPFPWWLILLLVGSGAVAYRVGRLTSEKDKERTKAGVSAVQNASAYVAEEGVIEPAIRRNRVLNALNQPNYWRQFAGGMSKDLAVIEGIGPKVQQALNEAGYRRLADLAAASPEELQQVVERRNWHFMDASSWVHQARLAALGDRDGLQALQSELRAGRGPLPPGAEENLVKRLMNLEEIAERSRLPNRVLDGVDSVSDGLSIVGNLGYAITGNERWKAAGEVGDALGIFGGIRQIAQCWQALRHPLPSRLLTGVTFLGKVTGVLSIVTGGISGVINTAEFIRSVQDENGWRADSTVDLLNALSGWIALGGGIALLVPGLQPIAGIALGISAVLSGAAVVVENWGWIKETYHQAGQIVEKVKRFARERAAEAVERGGQALAQGVERAGERLAGRVSRAAENAAQGILRTTQAAGQAVQVASQVVSRGIETLGNAVAQGVQQVTQAAAQAVNHAGQALARGSERAASTIASWARPFSPGLANSIERAGQLASQAVSSVTQGVSSTMAQAGQAVSHAIQHGAQAAASAVRQAGQVAANAIANVGQSTANAVRQAGQVVSSGVRSTAQATSSIVRSVTSWITGGLRRP